METCARCGHTLGIGRFCVNCGHPIGEPVPADDSAGPADRPAVAPPTAFEPPAPARYRLFADDSGTSGEAVPAVPASGRPGLPWVMGAVALLLIALIGGVLLWGGGDDEPTRAADDSSTRPDGGASTRPGSTAPTSDVSSTPPPSTTSPRGEGNQARWATPVVPATAAPSNDVQGRGVRYEATNMLDDQPDTAWRMDGSARGLDLVFDLREPTELTRVGLINGYAKNEDGYDAYPLNRRILRVVWQFDDGTEIRQEFVDGDRELQIQDIPSTVTTTVRLRILTVTKPGPGPEGRDYTAISDVLLYGDLA